MDSGHRLWAWDPALALTTAAAAAAATISTSTTLLALLESPFPKTGPFHQKACGACPCPAR